MNTLHLKYIIEVDKTRSISKAAKNLYMGQPNLSRAIKEFESRLGITIFERTPNGMIPTPQGAEFLVYAKNILSVIENVESMFSGNDKPQSFDLSTVSAVYILNAFVEFCKINKSKNISYNLLECDNLTAIQNINKGISNIAILRYNVDFEDDFKNLLDENSLKIKNIKTVSYCVYSSNQNEKNNITLSELEQNIQIFNGQTLIQNDNKLNEKNYICISDTQSQFKLLNELPSSYLWSEPLSDEILKTHNLKEIKCNESLKFKDVLVFKNYYQLLDIEKTFLKLLKT